MAEPDAGLDPVDGTQESDGECRWMVSEARKETMRFTEILHKALIVAGIVLAMMSTAVASILGEPLILAATALAATCAVYGYVKLQPADAMPEPAMRPMVGAAAR